MRLIIILLFFVLLISSVNAIKFDKDTTFTEDNFVYIFKEGLEFDNFDISLGGIRINGDEKIGLIIEGGQLSVTFYEFNEDVRNISFKSSVPQKIDFKISLDGIDQYLYDGEIYHKNSYNIGMDEKFFTFSNFNERQVNNIEDNIVLGDSTDSLPWYKQKMIEFEVSSFMDEDGIIHNKTFAITYIWFTGFFLFIIIIGFIIWSLRG